MTTDTDKQRTAEQLVEPAEEAAALARRLGLEPYDVNYWIVDHDEMNELIAYDGFQTRYPHWRWGMKYDRQRKQRQFLGGKAFEIVNNDDPSNAFLQVSNDLADQKAVITHVEAHADFFANNRWFGLFEEDGPNAAAMLERHARRIEDIVADPEVDREAVERFVDTVLTLEDNIEYRRAFGRDGGAGDPEDPADAVDALAVSGEVRDAVFGDDFDGDPEDPADARFPPEPEYDLLAFLREHGRAYDDDAGKAVEFEDWQREVIEILRREAYYFAPQRTTKVMNEGWACVDPDTRVFTTEGVIPMREVVDRQPTVSDGDRPREVYDSNVIADHETVTIETRRGFELTGSDNHRVRRPDGSWVRLDELAIGDEIAISGGNGIWPDEHVTVEWDSPEYTSLDDVARQADVSVWTVMRYRDVGSAKRSDAIEAALADYDSDEHGLVQRDSIRVPDTVTEPLARFLGLLVGDGHVPSNSRHVGFTAGKREHAEEVDGLLSELFEIAPSVKRQESRWRVYAYSSHLRDLLTDEFDLPTGKAAGEKTVPEPILRSPKPVVASFLRGLFDADGYAGEQGVILSTKSEDMSKTVQLLLTNFGILSRRREQTDGCYHVHLTGKSAQIFADEIGFGYDRKADRLATYLDELAWFETETWTDEITEMETGSGDVYDISVSETHRYAASGFVNHNSYWESLMMGEEAFADAGEFLDYADHQARVLNSPGFNPYKLGKQLWEYVENRANRREVLEHLLRVDGVTWRNFHDAVDFEAVADALAPPEALNAVDPDDLDEVAALPDAYVDRDAFAAARDGDVDVARYPWKLFTYEGLARRHYSLSKPQFRGFLARVPRSEVEATSRYLFETDRYASVEAALADVEFAAGWDRMFEVRESHNDVTFVDEFLTQEFVDDNDYFAYEYSQAQGDFRATSTDAEDVKKKLLLRFTNLGKPTIAVYDANHENRGELLLGHEYNGVILDFEDAEATLERVFELWGRPVVLRTITKQVSDSERERARREGREPEPEEVGLELRYDGESVTREELDWSEVEALAADEIDYDTKPEDWL